MPARFFGFAVGALFFLGRRTYCKRNPSTLGFGFNGNDEDGLKEMTLKEEWDRLDAETHHWLLDNPGCVLVPNTITARIQDTSDRQIEVDEHGQMIPSREDLDFIREKGTDVGAADISDDLRFFDATKPRESE
ncbi:hypothetical protein GCM10009861_08520 [Neomicrococcus aestuarii]